MVKAELPKIKKNIKSFILEEDGKVIDKSAAKVAISVSLISAGVIIHTEDVNAQGSSHTDEMQHRNHLFEPGEYNFDNGGRHGSEKLLNLNEEEDDVTLSGSGVSENVILPAKSFTSAHGNHYIHANGSGQQ